MVGERSSCSFGGNGCSTGDAEDNCGGDVSSFVSVFTPFGRWEIVLQLTNLSAIENLLWPSDFDFADQSCAVPEPRLRSFSFNLIPSPLQKSAFEKIL